MRRDYGPGAGWSADSIPVPLTPLSLVLSQRDTGVTGTGTAMGVDTRIPVTVTGTYVAPHVVFTGVFTTNGVQAYSLAFRKQ